MDTLKITIEQTDNETENVLSIVTVEYPNLPNALANTLQFDLIDAIAAQGKQWAKAKAERGAGAVEEAPRVKDFRR